MSTKNDFYLVFSNELSSWKSAGTIFKNLHSSYTKLLGSSLPHLNYSDRTIQTDYELLRSVRSVSKSKPRRLILIDDVTLPTRLLKTIDYVYEGKDLPDLYIHIYGNFTIRAKAWLQSEKLLRKFKIHFICASSRQKLLVGNFIKNSSQEISVCPFPVDCDDFFYSEELRVNTRHHLGIDKEESVLIFTGRICLQKNIDRLISEVAAAMSKSSKKYKLFIVGNYDDTGLPYFMASNHKLGTYYQKLNKTLISLDSHISEKIFFLGTKTASELNALYNAADAFLSLSLYHDEDFGMSPAEALICGLPVVLSDWGGYSDFAIDYDNRQNQNCSLVEVSLDRNGLMISSESFQKALSMHTHSLRDREARTKLSCDARIKYSIHAVSERLNVIHSKEPSSFQGFTNLFRRQSLLGINGSFSKGIKKGAFYEKIYSTYLRNDSNEPKH